MPVVKLFLTYVHANVPYVPRVDTPRFSSRPRTLPERRRLTASDSIKSIPPRPTTDPLTIPFVRKVWATAQGWLDGYVYKTSGDGDSDIWYDAYLTEADETLGRTFGCEPMAMDAGDVRRVLSMYNCREFLDYVVECVDALDVCKQRVETSAVGKNAPVTLVCCCGVWHAFVASTTSNSLAGLWPPSYGAPSTNGNLCTHDCLVTCNGVDSGPDAIRVVVVVHRILHKVQHLMPGTTSPQVSWFRGHQISTSSGVEAALAASLKSRQHLTVPNIRATWVAIMNWRSGLVSHDDVMRNALLSEVDCDAIDEDSGVLLGMNSDNLQDVLAVYGMLPGVDYVITDTAEILSTYAVSTRPPFILLGLGTFTGMVREAISTNWAILAPMCVKDFWVTRMDYQNLGVVTTSSQYRSFERAGCIGFCPHVRIGPDSGPDAIRVLVGLHRFLSGLSTMLPNAMAGKEVHVFRNGGSSAHAIRDARWKKNNVKLDPTGVWFTLPEAGQVRGTDERTVNLTVEARPGNRERATSEGCGSSTKKLRVANSDAIATATRVAPRHLRATNDKPRVVHNGMVIARNGGFDAAIASSHNNHGNQPARHLAVAQKLDFGTDQFEGELSTDQFLTLFGLKPTISDPIDDPAAHGLVKVSTGVIDNGEDKIRAETLSAFPRTGVIDNGEDKTSAETPSATPRVMKFDCVREMDAIEAEVCLLLPLSGTTASMQ